MSEHAVELADVALRLSHLRAASRATEPLTVGAAPTVQGLILSAITKLERRLEELRRSPR